MNDDFLSKMAKIPRGLTFEEREKAQQMVRYFSKNATANELKLARARIADVLAHHATWIDSHPDQVGKHRTVQLWIARGEVIHELLEKGHRQSLASWVNPPTRILANLTGIDDRWRDIPGDPNEPPPAWGYLMQSRSFWAKFDRESR